MKQSVQIEISDYTLLYGRGAASIGEQLGKSRDEAQEIIDKFFKAFPRVYNWIEQTKKDCVTNGYVEDIVGRRRRLPNIQLPQFQVTSTTVSEDFNPLLNSLGINPNLNNDLIATYEQRVKSCKTKKDVTTLQEEASKQGVTITDNGGRISQAERQAVNARIQGSAATITKLALIKLFNDEQLKNLGAKLINTVHDEILIEAPKENGESAAKRLTEVMSEAALELIPELPMKCDAYLVHHWYFDEMAATVQKTYKQLLDTDNSEQAYVTLKEKYSAFTDEQLKAMLEDI